MREDFGSLRPRYQEGEFVQVEGSACPKQNAKIQITVFGSPTGGTLNLFLKVNAVQETLTFNWNDDATAIDTELDTHPNIADGDVAVTGGPFPNATVEIEFQGNLANTPIELPLASWSLTGGSGVAVLPSYSRLGSAG